MSPKRLTILGSTGSIGQSALRVVEDHPDSFEVVSLSAARSVQKLAEQCGRLRPKLAAVRDAFAADQLKALLPSEWGVKVVYGPQGYLSATLEGEPDLVLSAMVGAAGLLPTYAAVQAGLNVALANKESLVAGGELVMAKAAETGAKVIPVDSEHSAIFQALAGSKPKEVRNLWLTASGGPFRDLPAEELGRVTPRMALNHPNWDMGPKISVDSATLMNKGLEVIEARWLFDQPPGRIKVVVHPQSMIHSLVEFVDGNLLAQLGPADMRLPIAYALGYPERQDWGLPTLDPTKLGDLTFEEPDLKRFPALGLAYAALKEGGTAPAVLSGANEVAVEGFLAGDTDFLGLVACVEGVLSRHQSVTPDSVAAVLEADRWARREARKWLMQKGKKAE